MTRMRFLLALALAGLLAAALAAAGCKKAAEANASGGPGADAALAKPAGPPPVIACDQPEYEFGTVGDGEEVKHTFVIKNTGQGALKIQRAQGG